MVRDLRTMGRTSESVTPLRYQQEFPPCRDSREDWDLAFLIYQPYPAVKSAWRAVALHNQLAACARDADRRVTCAVGLLA